MQDLDFAIQASFQDSGAELIRPGDETYDAARAVWNGAEWWAGGQRTITPPSVAPVRQRAPPPLREMVTALPCVLLQQLFDEDAPPGMLAYEKSLCRPRGTGKKAFMRVPS